MESGASGSVQNREYSASEVDSILEEVLTLTSVPHSTQSDLPELENIPFERVEEAEIDIPLPNDPNEIPLPAEIPNQPPSPEPTVRVSTIKPNF